MSHRSGTHTIKENIKESIKKGGEQLTLGNYKNVILSRESYQKLIDEYGKDNIMIYINKVDTYVQSKGKTYADYDATLRSWMSKDGIQKSDLDEYKSLVNNF